MKIFLCKSHVAGPVSGSDETLVAYATNLHQRGVRLTVVLLYPPSKTDQYYVRLKQAGVEVVAVGSYPLVHPLLRSARALLFFSARFFHLPTKSMHRSRKILQRIAQLLSLIHLEPCRAYFKRFPSDIIHIMTPDSGAAAMIRAANAARIPVLYQELGTPDYLPPLESHYERFIKVLPLCSEVAALSPRLAQQWRTKFSAAKSVSVLPLLVEDTSLLCAPKAERRAGVTFGFAARMEEGKGPIALVEAFAQVRQRLLANAYLKMAGDGPQGEAVKARARELEVLENCDFTGAYTALGVKSRFMQGLDVFVLPTLAEGTPNSIIEAMAHGLPVIASAVGGIPDCLTSESGILIAPGDLEALVNAMLVLASDPELRARMGQSARVRYEELFSPHVVLPTLLDTYHRIVRKTQKRCLASPASRSLHPWIEATQE